MISTTGPAHLPPALPLPLRRAPGVRGSSVPGRRAGRRRGCRARLPGGEQRPAGRGPRSRRPHPRPAAGGIYTRTAHVIATLRRVVRRQLMAGAPGVRLLGEIPVDQSGDEWHEWHRCEAIANVALGTLPLSSVCAYDRRELSDAICEGVEETHPALMTPAGPVANHRYVDPATVLRRTPTTRAGRAEDTRPRSSWQTWPMPAGCRSCAREWAPPWTAQASRGSCAAVSPRRSPRCSSTPCGTVGRRSPSGCGRRRPGSTARSRTTGTGSKTRWPATPRRATASTCWSGAVAGPAGLRHAGGVPDRDRVRRPPDYRPVRIGPASHAVFGGGIRRHPGRPGRPGPRRPTGAGPSAPGAALLGGSACRAVRCSWWHPALAVASHRAAGAADVSRVVS